MKNPQYEKPVDTQERQARGTARSVVDALGDMWRVYERNSPVYADCCTPRSLMASNASGPFHRLRNYPSNWADLTDAELLSLVEYGR